VKKTVDLDELRFMDITDKKISKRERKISRSGHTVQRILFEPLLFSFWPHNTTMLLNSPSRTVETTPLYSKTFTKKKKNRDVPLKLGQSLSGFIENPRIENVAFSPIFCNLIGRKSELTAIKELIILDLDDTNKFRIHVKI